MNDLLSKKVIEEIDSRKIEPIPKWHFVLRRSVFWSLAVISVILGAIAVAVTIFIFFDHDWSVFGLLDQTLFEDILLAIPYLWLLFFGLFIAVSNYSFRQTKTGYKYNMIRVASIILGLSIFLGVALNTLDAGDYINHFLLNKVPAYDRLVYTREDVWTRADRGLLAGEVMKIVDSTHFTLNDLKNHQWNIDTSNVQSFHPTLHEAVKMKGTKIDTDRFQVTSIEDWE